MVLHCYFPTTPSSPGHLVRAFYITNTNVDLSAEGTTSALARQNRKLRLYVKVHVKFRFQAFKKNEYQSFTLFLTFLKNILDL